METLIGLVLLMTSIIAVIKFNKTSGSLASGAEARAQVWAEEMHAEATIERANNFKAFKEEVKDLEIISHESYMDVLSGKAKLSETH